MNLYIVVRCEIGRYLLFDIFNKCLLRHATECKLKSGPNNDNYTRDRIGKKRRGTLGFSKNERFLKLYNSYIIENS